MHLVAASAEVMLIIIVFLQIVRVVEMLVALPTVGVVRALGVVGNQRLLRGECFAAIVAIIRPMPR